MRPVRKADNLPLSYAIVTKPGKLNFLEPFGPVQACNGTAVPLPYLYISTSRSLYAVPNMGVFAFP